MIWIGRSFIVVGAILVWLASMVMIDSVAVDKLSDKATITMAASACLGILFLFIGISMEEDGIDAVEDEPHA